MGTKVARGSLGRRVLTLAALALACVSSSAEREPREATPPDVGPRRTIVEAPRPPAVRREPAPATSCPLPSRVPSSGYDLAKLGLFSKTLFYVRENHPVEIDPRANALVVSALEAVQAVDPEILVEHESDPRPRWIAVTVKDQRCTLNIERVNAPWSLRSTLQDAMRFVEANLAPLPAAEAKARGLAIEMAATNGMLSGLDAGSRLLDAETYRRIRPRGSKRLDLIGAQAGSGEPGAPSNAGGDRRELPSATVRPGAAGSKVGYLRLGIFAAGAADLVDRALGRFDAEQVKGVVLDLRDNPGGLLDEAVKVADAFIKSGRLGSMVSKRDRKDLVAHDGGHEPATALIVLVNGETASAAELVAAAVKDLGRGVVLGEPTAGAASIRVYFDLPTAGPRLPPEDQDSGGDDLLGLVLTTGHLLAAGGEAIDGVGVKPDLQPACPAEGQPGSGGAGSGSDCLLAFAHSLLVEAHGPQRSALLSAAKTLAR